MRGKISAIHLAYTRFVRCAVAYRKLLKSIDVCRRYSISSR